MRLTNRPAQQGFRDTIRPRWPAVADSTQIAPVHRPDVSRSAPVAGQTAMKEISKVVLDLDLVDEARDAAQALLDAHPEVIFTSGRRDVEDQARAMASNVVPKRHWIKETYKASEQRRQLQKWVDDHPEAKTKSAIATGLLGVMRSWTADATASFSKHLSGRAFDVQPVKGAKGEEIKKTIRALNNLDKFLDKEGGLVRWHAQFNIQRDKK